MQSSITKQRIWKGREVDLVGIEYFGICPIKGCQGGLNTLGDADEVKCDRCGIIVPRRLINLRTK